MDEIVNVMGFVLIALTWFALRDMQGRAVAGSAASARRPAQCGSARDGRRPPRGTKLTPPQWAHPRARGWGRRGPWA